jgi:hypothetical protein
MRVLVSVIEKLSLFIMPSLVLLLEYSFLLSLHAHAHHLAQSSHPLGAPTRERPHEAPQPNPRASFPTAACRLLPLGASLYHPLGKGVQYARPDLTAVAVPGLAALAFDSLLRRPLSKGVVVFCSSPGDP